MPAHITLLFPLFCVLAAFACYRKAAACVPSRLDAMDAYPTQIRQWSTRGDLKVGSRKDTTP